MSVKRAKFMEMVGRALRVPPARPDALFVLGLFSLLDSLLGQPMGEIIKDLPLSEDLSAALLGGHNEARQLLNLAQDMEHADWKGAQQYLAAIDLPARTASALNADALRFAGELVRDVCALPPPAAAGR
jgi:EAL and modified HD-GYP domain-containing signal transduction protein